MVTPFLFNDINNCIISRDVLLSSAPVGSSAIINLGWLTIARAIATRCLCPPDNNLTDWFEKFSNPTCFKLSETNFYFIRLGIAEYSNGSSTF